MGTLVNVKIEREGVQVVKAVRDENGGKVNCLFCYGELARYEENVAKAARRLTIQTTFRLLQYVGNHLEFERDDVNLMTKKKRNEEGRHKLLPGNLPLCGGCKGMYYGKLYDAFVEYEMAMDKLNDKIVACITKRIATSAKQRPDSTGVEETTEEEEESEEHVVMKMVKLFRKKVVDKNPSGYFENDNGGDTDEDANTPDPPPIVVKPTTPNPKLPTNSAIKNLIHVVKATSVQPLRTPEERQKEVSKYFRNVKQEMLGEKSNPVTPPPSKPLDYYAVANPQPGIIQIIPMAAPPNLPKGVQPRSRADRHYNAHRMKANTCKFCQKYFESKHLLTRHMVAEHGMEKPFKCSQCDYRCINEAYMKEHSMTHLDVSLRPKPYQCDLCGKEFFAKVAFGKHMKEHKGVKPTYICEICGKQFTCSKSRQLCVDKHNGVKNFECPYDGCGKKFLRKEVLVIHERTHTGEKPFTCSVCGKGFSQRTPLRTHLKNVHNKK